MALGTSGPVGRTWVAMRGLLATTCSIAWLSACAPSHEDRGSAPYQPSAGDDDGDGDEDETGLDVEPTPDTDAPPPIEGGGEGGDEGFSCDPEDAQSCPCPDGPGEGVQSCVDGIWGPCICDDPAGTDGGDEAGDPSGGDPSASDTGGETGEPGGEPLPTEACFPGADNQWTTCVMLHAFDPDAPPDGYAYPEALGGDPNYRKPVAFLDLEAEDPDLAVAPNFTLGELAQLSKGRWAIVQPHAVESLQALRDELGPLAVNSGYRSPDYNASIGGAGASRHMYGDGFDLDPVDVSLATLEAACTAGGGMLVEYETHVHCDWRFDEPDEGFFGAANQASPHTPTLAANTRHDAVLHHHEGWLWTADAGFDEGAPTHRWRALDRDGVEIATSRMPIFLAPAQAATVQVTVGARVERSLVLP
jgi:hypothetical protein